MIAYCITVYNEFQEIERLLSLLSSIKENDDEIVTIHTFSNEEEKSSNTHNKIENICKKYSCTYDNFHFKKNFADLKNYMNSKVSSNQKYIFNLDADETMDLIMLKRLRKFLSQSDIDLIYVPRVNIVEDISQKDIDHWSWRTNEHGWINWPDYQPRIYRNLSTINWTSKVHEHLEGYSTNAAIEADGNIYISHIKTIEKQRQQNQFYDQILNNKNTL